MQRKFILIAKRKEERGRAGLNPEINLSRKDLYKYDNKTKIKNLNETKLPELGDKDYLIYSDKSQLGGNDVLKVTVALYDDPIDRYVRDEFISKFYKENKTGVEFDF